MPLATLESEKTVYLKELLEQVKKEHLDGRLLKNLQKELEQSHDSRVGLVKKLNEQLMPKIDELSTLLLDQPGTMKKRMNQSRQAVGAIMRGEQALPTDRMASTGGERALEQTERLRINAAKIVQHLFEDDIPENIAERKKINRDILISLVGRADKLITKVQGLKQTSDKRTEKKMGQKQKMPNIDAPTGYEVFSEDELEGMFGEL